MTRKYIHDFIVITALGLANGFIVYAWWPWGLLYCPVMAGSWVAGEASYYRKERNRREEWARYADRYSRQRITRL